MNRARGDAGQGVCDGADMVRGRAAASSCDIQQTFRCHGSDSLSHIFRTLIVASHFIWKSGVRIAADSAVTPLRDFFHERCHLCRSQRTVKTESQKGIVTHCCVERLEGLACEGSATAVAHRNGYHYGDVSLKVSG